jgi:hypothetical protein
MATPQIREIVRVDISLATVPLSQSGFSTLLIAGDSDKLPANDVIVLTFDDALVASNTFDAKINGTPITQVVFTTDSDTTMDLIAAEFQSDAAIATAVATGTPKRVITITAAGDETAPVIITDPVVAGGASQANVTNVRTPAVRTKSYTSLSAVAVDFATTDPEYLAASDFFAQNPHPTYLKIGRVVNGNDWSDELTLINNVDSNWYFLVITSRTQADVEDAAAWVNGLTKQLHTASADPNIHNSAVSSDIASVFEVAEYSRAQAFFNELAANTYPDVAWISDRARLNPYKATWNFKTLIGVTPSDTLTDAQRATILETKNANGYFTVGGRSIMRVGQVASGQFIDDIWGRDYLESQMTIGIFNVIADAPRIPYTDNGAAAIEGAIRASLDEAIDGGYLVDSAKDGSDLYNGQPYEVIMGAAASKGSTNKGNRIWPDITFRAQRSGAIHEAEVQGTVAL